MGIIAWLKKLFAPTRPIKSIDEITEEAKKEKEKQDFENAAKEAEAIMEEVESEVIEESNDEENIVKESEPIETVEEEATHVDETEPDMEEEKKEEPIAEPVYRVWTAEDKEIFASLLRPIVRVFNKERKSEYSDYTAIPEDELKSFKVYGNIVDEGKLLIFKFTQSDAYNNKIQDFVLNVITDEFINAVSECKELPEDMKLDLEVEDGKIKIRENLNK